MYFSFFFLVEMSQVLARRDSRLRRHLSDACEVGTLFRLHYKNFQRQKG